MSDHAVTRVASGSSPVDDDHIRRVVRKMLGGIVVPLLGAGVNVSGRPAGSRYSGPQDPYLPSGTELAEFLAYAFEYPQLSGETDLLRVAQFLDVMEGSGELYGRFTRSSTQATSPGLCTCSSRDSSRSCGRAARARS